MSYLVDRRLNGRNKSAVNRERFLRRYKTQVLEAVKRMIDKRRLADVVNGGEVRVPRKDIAEPAFDYGAGGDREFVLPGNRSHIKGDRIARPGGSAGSGGGEAGEGESQDDFVFTLSREEFLDIFFDDLELPRLERTALGQVEQKKSVRAGYTMSGAPANLAVLKTMSSSLARRLALSASLRNAEQQARDELERARAAGLATSDIEEEIARIAERMAQLPFLEELDLRYRHRVQLPEPVARAVMFCLMDVSASMDEEKKDLAKRFFTLLYLFLTRKYRHVDVVFIRHTDDAEEVDEDTFFHDPKSGGTVVLAALELAHRIAGERYARDWNIYAAQASDGDAFGSDPARSTRFLRENLLPLARYFAYLELAADGAAAHSNLWAEYELLAAEADNFAMRRAAARGEIYPVFRELFRKESQ
ncbi:MAG: YeaH/YhbH family protein [Burkholderiales bacterium]